MDLIEFNKQYVRSRCKLYPGFYDRGVIQMIDPAKAVVVFGDNVKRCGMGGQATIRLAPCAFGLVTKRAPSMESDAYFTDDNKSDYQWLINDINRLHKKLLQNPDLVVYFPEHGLGTGLSEMPTRCPELFKQMNDIIYERFGIDYRIKE